MKRMHIVAVAMTSALALLPATADARGGGFHGGGFHSGLGGFRGAGFGSLRAGRIGGGGARFGLAGAGAARRVASNRVVVRNVAGRGASDRRGVYDSRRFGYGGLGVRRQMI